MSVYSVAIRRRPETLRSVGFGSIGSSFVALGSAMQNPVIQYKITNYTDANLIISEDGVNNHDTVPANGFTLYDVQANKGKGKALALSKGDVLWVKQESSAPTLGTVYLTTFYASI